MWSLSTVGLRARLGRGPHKYRAKPSRSLRFMTCLKRKCRRDICHSYWSLLRQGGGRATMTLRFAVLQNHKVSIGQVWWRARGTASCRLPGEIMVSNTWVRGVVALRNMGNISMFPMNWQDRKTAHTLRMMVGLTSEPDRLRTYREQNTSRIFSGAKREFKMVSEDRSKWNSWITGWSGTEDKQKSKNIRILMRFTNSSVQFSLDNR